MRNYSDIIILERHVSKKHPQMSLESRAAQFAPFAALNGYADAINETARLTDRKIELTEEMKTIINDKLQVISSHIVDKPQAKFTYFIKDKKKNGGMYLTETGNVRRIDLIDNIIILTNKKKIIIDDIIGISGI